MDGIKLTTSIREQLTTYTGSLASLFSDSRREQFITDMVTGLLSSGHVHLTAVARGISGLHPQDQRIHAVEKRLSRHLGSDHWDMSPLKQELLQRSAALVTDDALIAADTTDLAKYYARHLEGLGRVHDGSDPQQRIAPGYCVFEAYVRVGKWQMFPLVVEPLKTYSGAPGSENIEFLKHILTVHQATHGQGTWQLDRGFDRRKLYQPLVKQKVAFVVRQRGDRLIETAQGHRLLVQELVAQTTCPRPKRWPRGGVQVTQEVCLPEVSDRPFLLVIGWKYPNSESPLVLLVSPDARRSQRTGRWYVKAYLKRWGVEDATRGIKQHFHLEKFLVRTWLAISRLLVLVALAFWWLNLWGEDHFTTLRESLINHPWRLKKTVTYLFNWIATMLIRLLHPAPY